MDWTEILKIVGPALAVGGALVAITRYVTQLQDRVESADKMQDAKNKISELEQESVRQTTGHQIETKDLQDKLARLTEQNQKLEERYRVLLEGGSSAAALKATIDGELSQTADRLGAAAYSILVPSPSAVPDASIENLVFLCLVPDNPSIRSERISIESVAGRVLKDDKTVITHDPASAGAFSAQTDQVAHFKTANMLVAPLHHNGRCIGVVEFLNKRSGLSFDPTDIDLVDEAAVLLGPKVGEFTSDLRNLKSLGFTPRQRPTEATILVSDISNSSLFSRRLDASVAIDLFNQYMEALCEIGMRFGGTVEQLQGDGFIMTFNVKRTLDDHRSAALKAAFDMQRRFRDLKAKWITLRYSGARDVFNRIGVTSGPVQKAEMGPPQFRLITVMGDAVNSAAHLCQYAPRDRDVIMVGKPLYERLESKPSAKEASLKVSDRSPVESAFDVEIPN